jgi:hypothetical protein
MLAIGLSCISNPGSQHWDFMFSPHICLPGARWRLAQIAHTDKNAGLPASRNILMIGPVGTGKSGALHAHVTLMLVVHWPQAFCFLLAACRLDKRVGNDGLCVFLHFFFFSKPKRDAGCQRA